MSAAVGLMGVLPSDDPDDVAWDALVGKARALVPRLRVGRPGRRSDENTGDDDTDGDAFLDVVSALTQITKHADDDEEFIAALGEVNGHDALLRLVMHEHEEVSTAAGDALQVCADLNPPGSPFPARGGSNLRPDRTVLKVGNLHGPLDLHLRHAREHLGGAKKSIPNIAWHSSVVLSRWIAFRPELFENKECLEIGAGLGAPGFTASAFGAQSVTLTDVDGAAVRNLRYNAGRGCGLLMDDDDEKKNVRVSEESNVNSAIDLPTRRRWISQRCVAVSLDWNDYEPLLGNLREKVGREMGRVNARTLPIKHDDDDDCEDELSEKTSSKRFPVILGADVVHEEGMAEGVVRCLVELLDRENGIAVVINPAPEHRAGAAKLPILLENAGFEFSVTDVTSLLLRVGMEEETEDIKLQLFVVRLKGMGGGEGLPDTRDVTDAWHEFVNY